MNERIKELTDLAMRQLGCGYTVEDAGLFASSQVRELINETAEIIIRDCYSVIIKSQRGHFNPATSWDAVKQHFGVEE